MGNRIDKEKLWIDMNVQDPPNWIDLQTHHSVQSLSSDGRLLGFNY